MPIKSDKIISNLTINEKLSLVVGIGFPGRFGNPESRVPGAAGETSEIKRLNIKKMILADGPAGVRIKPKRINDQKNYFVTSFPIATMLASTWNKELVKKIGNAMGNEAKEYGIDILLGPALNIHRNPLCGRNFEYFSEDPVLSGIMASEIVKGIQENNIGACVKHFVANNQETNRMFIDTIIPERTLREIYLRGFEIAIKNSNPWSLMTAYNKVNGKYCSQNEYLLKRILRDEWDFSGMVMTDWYAGDNPVEQIKSGNDLIMPGKTFQINQERNDEIQELRDAMKNNKLTEEDVNLAVKNILNVLFKTPSQNNYKYSNNPDLKEHASTALKAAEEGIILLKNNNVFPFKDDGKIALFGTAQIETLKGGTGSGDTNPAYIINIAEGFIENNINIDKKLFDNYQRKIKLFREEKFKHYTNERGRTIYPKLPEDIFSLDEIENIALNNDIALITISRISGEFKDRSLSKGDFYLSDDEKNLIEKVSKIFKDKNKKVGVILNIGGIIEIKSWENLVDGIMLIWQGGQETGRAVAKICKGENSPSGKLPMTIPNDYYDIPTTNFPGEPKEDPQKIIYEEGIFVGYRFFDTFNVNPLYEFGYGLSYTKFKYSDLSVNLKDESVSISYKIKNIGDFPGKEISQIYVRAPKRFLNKPYQELKGFHKTKELNPGEFEEINIEIPLINLSSWNNAWFLEEGIYEFRVGASSRDIRLKKSINIAEHKF